tara:strand:+ start:2959 stop:3438 length:480 start_codon:yes stop_codon:yes gene_type:complete
MLRIIFIILCVILNKNAFSADEHYCLAEAIYFEARNQPLIGQKAVGLVVINRVKDATFPNTPCKVTRQAKYNNYQPILHKCHFSFYCDGKPERIFNTNAWTIAKQIAYQILNNEIYDFTNGSLYYHAVYIQPPQWAKEMRVMIIIDKHIFYGENKNGQR